MIIVFCFKKCVHYTYIFVSCNKLLIILEHKEIAKENIDKMLHIYVV